MKRTRKQPRRSMSSQKQDRQGAIRLVASLTMLVGCGGSSSIEEFANNVTFESLESTSHGSRGCQSNISVATENGSAELRSEINRLYNLRVCLTLELSDRYRLWQEAEEREEALSYWTELARESIAKLNACLDAEGIGRTKVSSIAGDPKSPCNTEFQELEQRQKRATEAAQLRKVVPRPQSTYNAWISTIRDLAILADQFPDAVDPTVLPQIIREGRAADSCGVEDWCLPDDLK